MFRLIASSISLALFVGWATLNAISALGPAQSATNTAADSGRTQPTGQSRPGPSQPQGDSAPAQYIVNDILDVPLASPGDELVHEAFIPVGSRAAEWLGTRVSCSCIETTTDIVETDQGLQARIRMVWRIKDDAIYAFVRGENRMGADVVGLLKDGRDRKNCRIGIQTLVRPRLSISPRNLTPQADSNSARLTISRGNLLPADFAQCQLQMPAGVTVQAREQSADQLQYELGFEGFPGRTGSLQVVCDGRSWTVPFSTNDPIGVDLPRTIFLERPTVRAAKQFQTICKIPADCEIGSSAELWISDERMGEIPMRQQGHNLVFELAGLANLETAVWNAQQFQLTFMARRGDHVGRKRIKCWWRR